MGARPMERVIQEHIEASCRLWCSAHSLKARPSSRLRLTARVSAPSEVEAEETVEHSTQALLRWPPLPD